MSILTQSAGDLDKRLNLHGFRASDLLPKRFALTQSDADEMFQNQKVLRVQAGPTEIEVILEDVNDDVTVLEAYLIATRNEVPSALKATFRFISIPLDHVETVENKTFERLGALNAQHNLISGSRGRVVIRARGPATKSVIPAAEALMQHFYDLK